MILVTRDLLVSRVESEVNNDLRSLLHGSDSIIGLHKMRQSAFVRLQAITRSIEDILCRSGGMSATKESNSRSAKRFPSQQNSLESVKCDHSPPAVLVHKAQTLHERHACVPWCHKVKLLGVRSYIRYFLDRLSIMRPRQSMPMGRAKKLPTSTSNAIHSPDTSPTPGS